MIHDINNQAGFGPAGSGTISRNAKIGLICLLLSVSSASYGDIIWSGDFETGNFTQWPNGYELGSPFYWGMPAYCRPGRHADETNNLAASYYGDGSCLEIVSQPVRQGRYAAKFTVKNSANGSEPADNDGSVATRRRTELWMHKGVPQHYGGMPYLGERWVSISHYVPADWDDDGSGFGPLVFQIKPYNEPGSSGLSPTVSIELGGKGWKINHRWSQDPNMTREEMPWQWSMFYAADEGGAPYPRENNWPGGLADFPDVQASHAALQSVNKGGWTDWVFHVKFDARGAGNGGSGFLSLWKREDNGPWVHVLHILPKQTTRGGLTFNHGIGYNAPPSGSNPGGFGPIAGLYLGKNQVWGLPANRVIYIDNVKVGSSSATFADLSPDGSTPDGSAEAPPKSPAVEIQ